MDNLSAKERLNTSVYERIQMVMKHLQIVHVKRINILHIHVS